MKYVLPFCSMFLVACSLSLSDADGDKFDPSTTHVVDGIHVKLMDLKQYRVHAKQSPSEPDYSKGIHSFAGHAVDLGMGNVPVLDQGQFGTCVTFSTTAALDALISKGDFISQQCSLELFKGLGNDIWNGAYAPSEVLDPLKTYGVVSQSACPDDYGNTAASLSPSSYKPYVDSGASQVVSLSQYAYTTPISLQAVKEALSKGHRVLIAFQLKNVSQAVRGYDVKVNGVSYQGGLWACSQSLWTNYCGSADAGHEVLVIGYDDDQQLLKIRNSWSAVVGENGNYYMSYKFFESMAMDSTEVW